MSPAVWILVNARKTSSDLVGIGAIAFFNETNLAVVRAKSGGQLQPVSVDCVGPLSGWT